MPRDKVKEGSYRLGMLVQMYIGPKIFQSLEGTVSSLPEPDARISNEARVILEKALPAFEMSAWLPAITTEPTSLDSLQQGPLKAITGLIPKIEAKLAEIQGEGPAISAFRFSWNAVYYMQLRKYIPHRTREIQMAQKILVEHGTLLGLGESQVQEFLADPKGRWGSTFDLVIAEQKRSFIERLQPKEPKYSLMGEAADGLIRRWLERM
jgi:hypothetical protein